MSSQPTVTKIHLSSDHYPLLLLYFIMLITIYLFFVYFLCEQGPCMCHFCDPCDVSATQSTPNKCIWNLRVSEHPGWWCVPFWSQLHVQRLMLGSYHLCEQAFTQIVLSSVLLPWAQNWRVAYWQAWLRIDVRRGKKRRKGDLKQLEYPGRVDFYYPYSLNRYILSAYDIHHSRPWGYSSEQSPALVELAFQIGI